MTELKGIVRIADADVIGTKTLYYALRKVTGVSFMMANAVCITSGLGRDTLVGSLSDEQLKKIETLLKNPNGIPAWLYNRRKDVDTGLDKHLIAADMKLQTEFDIKIMKKNKSFKGIRHSMGQPVRGQKTRSHFRSGKSIGVKKTKGGKKG